MTFDQFFSAPPFRATEDPIIQVFDEFAGLLAQTSSPAHVVRILNRLSKGELETALQKGDHEGVLTAMKALIEAYKRELAKPDES